MRHYANKAESSFFSSLLTDDGITKEAEVEEEDFFGIKTVSPQVIKNLESQAGTANKENDTKPESKVDIGKSDYIDTEPKKTLKQNVEPSLPNRETHGKLFTQIRSHPLQILDILRMRYKDTWLNWEPSTLLWALRRDFGSVGEVSRNKIQALLLAETTDIPWIDWDTFENCGQTWNDFLPIFGSWQPMTPMQIAFTVSILREIRPDEKFGHEVNAYIAAVLDEHGWTYAPPEWFADAQSLLDRKDWLVGLRTEVASTWKYVKNMPLDNIEWESDDALNIHLLKMATVDSYLKGRSELRKYIPGAQLSSSTTSPPVP